jgi:hypothetical protein
MCEGYGRFPRINEDLVELFRVRVCNSISLFSLTLCQLRDVTPKENAGEIDQYLTNFTYRF